MRTLYVIGDDKLGRKAINALGDGHRIFLNRSTDIGRVLRLVRRGSVSAGSVLKIAIAELLREDYPIDAFPVVRTNSNLLQVIVQQQPERVVCYRAGIVLNREVLRLKPQFLNIHCAELPRYGGLGALSRALRDAAFDQNACLHEIVTDVDAGKVHFRKAYQLSSSKSFRENEDIAYSAGLEILLGLASGEISV